MYYAEDSSQTVLVFSSDTVPALAVYWTHYGAAYIAGFVCTNFETGGAMLYRVHEEWY